MPTFDHLENYTRGWVVGNFSPSIFNLKECEIGISSHRKNESTIPHRHNHSTEINIVLSGAILVNGQKLKSGDIFIYHKLEVSNVKFLKNSTICIIRVPSSPNDKEIIL
jgi:hypothetical protein